MENTENIKGLPVIEVIDNGPLKITGNIILRDIKRDTTDKPSEVYLCRCGRSSTKPYCDGSHDR